MTDPADKPKPTGDPTPGAKLRDPIRHALFIINGQGHLWGTDMMEPDEYGEQADVVLRQMFGESSTPEPDGSACAHCGSQAHTWNDCHEYTAVVAEDKTHSCDNCEGVDSKSCLMNKDRSEGNTASCGPDCYETNVEPHAHRWAQTVHTTDGTRTVHIPYLDGNGHEAGSIRVHHTDVRTLALMLCDDPLRITDQDPGPETDEERADRLETESEHAAGIHGHCGVTCEEEFPSDMLRNTILVRAIPGSATMLDELIRRAGANR